MTETSSVLDYLRAENEGKRHGFAEEEAGRLLRVSPAIPMMMMKRAPRTTPLVGSLLQ